jgi:ankyrin repeat protein
MEKEQEFYYAVKENNLDELKELASSLPDFCQVIRPYDQCLLFHAAQYNSYEVSEFLIERGCDINEADEEGLSPLHVAVEYNNLKIAELLIRNNAKVDIKDKHGNTPLSRAVFNYRNDMKMITLLIAGKANPFVENNFGSSPYDFALTTKKDEVIIFFNLMGFEKK